ncbi:GTPase-associated system all-helical protein GASH [Dyella sp.]|uniref:GTPase-associated system all-helical protein GASH n=1 Tax=Dyella sp. TaxID=1869338 RepID=UPI003F7D4E31
MENTSLHMRMTGLVVSDTDVDTRQAAITELSSSWGKITNAPKILAKSAEIAASLGGDGHAPEFFAAEIQGVVQKHASAFLHVERPLEVGICAGMAAVNMMKSEPGTGGWTTPDVYANALWSALSFQPPLVDDKREALRREVLDVAQARAINGANKARERVAVPDMGDLTVTLDAEGKYGTNFKRAVNGCVEALRRNAALDREELDFLWWVQLGRSRLLNVPWAKIPEAKRLVIAGIEGAGHLRRLPSDVHHEVVLRTLEADPECDMNELLLELGDDCARLSEALSSTVAETIPQVFPLLHAIITGQSTPPGASVKCRASTWGGRALLEAALARFATQGVVNL